MPLGPVDRCRLPICRQSMHAAVIIPSHGRFVGASSLPFSEYRRRPGDRVGLNWRIPNVHGKRALRHVVYDTNWWKSFINARLCVSMGDRGCLSLFGTNFETHRMFAEHLTSEYFIRPRHAAEALTNGSSDRSSPTTTGSTVWLVLRSCIHARLYSSKYRRFKESDYWPHQF